MATDQRPRRALRLAPDWLPNTNHIGLYVAQTLGYYAAEGVDLDILPFDGEAMPNRKIVTGETDLALMPQQSIMSLRARGTDIVSVAALVQPNTTTLAVRAESGITRPEALAGRRYASYGTEFEVPMVEEMIRRDGGARGPELVSAEKLDILSALFAGEIDVSWGFYAWEGLQAELAGHTLRHFFVAESGVPHEYFPLLFTTRAFLAAEPQTVTAVVRATARGYAYAARHPADSADLFLRSVPHNRLPVHADELVHRSMAWLAPRLNGTLDGQSLADPWGWHNPVQWAAFAAFIRRLADLHQLTLPEPEAESQGYTNAFIPLE
jgi:ABC-type nitrate/sulfonate/bicarbonate transport system substrate-binding protein